MVMSMATIKEVARAANVSTATVSNVLNGTSKVKDKTRARVLQTAEQLNYTPNVLARSLKSRRSHTIGIITEEITAFNTPEIVDGIDEFREQNDYHFILSNLRMVKHFGYYSFPEKECHNLVNDAVETLLANQVEGIIYVGNHFREIDYIAKDLGVPLVYCYCYPRDQSRPYVHFDDEMAAYDVTQYLTEFGHTKIGLIAGPENSIHTLNRVRGYQRALYKNNLLFNPEWVRYRDWERSSGYEIGAELIKKKVTAVFAMNDIIAAGVLEAAKEAKISVPNELSVVGFDNRDCSSYLFPKLTTVDLPLHEIGKQSVKLLVSMINQEKNLPREIKLSCKIVKRDSVGAALL